MPTDTTTSDDMESGVLEAIDAIRPALQADGGDIVFRTIDDDGVVHVELVGACGTCPVSTMTLKESTDELIKLGADITNIVEYDEAAAAKSASGKLEAYTQRIDFTLNGKHDCIAEAFASVDAATARAEYYSRISETATIGAYVYRHDLVVYRIKETASLEEAEAFNQLLTQVDQ